MLSFIASYDMSSVSSNIFVTLSRMYASTGRSTPLIFVSPTLMVFMFRVSFRALVLYTQRFDYLVTIVDGLVDVIFVCF